MTRTTREVCTIGCASGVRLGAQWALGQALALGSGALDHQGQGLEEKSAVCASALLAGASCAPLSLILSHHVTFPPEP